MKVLITRQKNFAEKTKDLLTQVNIDSVIAPVIEINYLDVKKEIENSINIYDFIILTSQNSLIGLDKNFNMNNLKVFEQVEGEKIFFRVELTDIGSEEEGERLCSILSSTQFSCLLLNDLGSN